MRYSIVINPKTKKVLSKIEKNYAFKIRDKIRSLTENPRPSDVVKLTGFSNVYRLRVGNYRIIYEIHDDRLLILVVNVGHRRDIYKR